MAGGRWHDNSIWQQLDLLFEFCQWALARFALLGPGLLDSRALDGETEVLALGGDCAVEAAYAPF